jgi:hypothetical protein
MWWKLRATIEEDSIEEYLRINKNNQTKNGGFVPRIYCEPPVMKPYKVMLELLKDAEKYESKGDIDVGLSILKTLGKYIDNYIAEQNKIKKISTQSK